MIPKSTAPHMHHPRLFRILSIYLIPLLLLSANCSAIFDSNDFEDYGCGLMRDLMIVDSINRKMHDRMPVTFSHYLQGGYFLMPSARVAKEGDFGAGYSYVPPYRNVSLRFQLIDRLELTGSYRVYHGVLDPILSQHGFGDFADRGIGIKLVVLHPEETNYVLPGIAIGYDDFIGTSAFKSRWVVATKVWPKLNLEASLGLGEWRIHGIFGGVLWMPFRCDDNPYLKGISLAAEYDAIAYKNPKREPHPNGREVSYRINYGIKYRVFDFLDLSVSSLRGKTVAASAAMSYNIGDTQGFLPKIFDALPYSAPVNTEPLGCLRTTEILAQDFIYAFRKHGFTVMEMRLGYNTCCEKVLWLKIHNNCYWREKCLREQLQALTAHLVPSGIDNVVVVIDEDGTPVQEYLFRSEFLEWYRDNCICDYELAVVSPMREYDHCPLASSDQLFYQPLDTICPWVYPKTQFLFGSSRGKFKYALGLSPGIDGYLWSNVYYRFQVGYVFTSSVPPMKSDLLNPSQLPVVHTDELNYLRPKEVTIDAFYLQKNWNIGDGMFARTVAGYFSQFYAGFDAEFLYYPVHSDWAIGVDGAWLRKRKYNGIGFMPLLLKFEGTTPTYIKFPLYQYFLDLYYTWKPMKLDFKVSSGRFLAGDYGARGEISRLYNSGLRIFIWYTATNAHDMINGQVYHDTGIGFTMPLDIFYLCSSRKQWGNSIAAWLRDSGYRTDTGDRLYDMIRWTRY